MAYSNSNSDVFDVVVIGGGPVGLAAGYEVAKAGSKVMILEQNNFFNQAGSSGDLARMFRTMYTEEFMAKLAIEAMKHWDALEKDAGVSLRSLLGPKANLDKFGMFYKELTAEQIEEQYPFKNLDPKWIGLFAPDNGVINVQLLLRTLYSLAKDYGAQAKQHTQVRQLRPLDSDKSIWEVHATVHDKEVNIGLRLEIWEMVATYFNTNPGPNGTIFPSMWFQFGPSVNGRSQLFYGFPALPWGPPNVVRIAVDAATRTIDDPSQRQANVLDPRDIQDTQDFVRDHVVGVDATVPASTVGCLQTNVFEVDNMFVLDFLPEKYLQGGAEKSIAIFTAGWAMKFVPTLGKALAEMALTGKSDYKLDEFSITRPAPEGKEIIVEDPVSFNASTKKEKTLSLSRSDCTQSQGSSCRSS
ncbi:sarcosine oxidase [Fusarium acutatum]|uniref:Sarcosine oxidase n=1 Tax=Fusarium acutatum TaxID=78861 RepID=A0A8H4J9G4_9HYPO|nr:sarcosine oxidase [Fusarium acutatum]